MKDELTEAARVMEREAMTPMQYPSNVAPRWEQVALRMLQYYPMADGTWRMVVMSACKAYLGDEA